MVHRIVNLQVYACIIALRGQYKVFPAGRRRRTERASNRNAILLTALMELDG